jgi:hypothetical protein
MLVAKRVDATHRKDGVASRLAARLSVDLEPLQWCPMLLPAKHFVPTALDNGQRSPRKLLRAVVARLLGRARTGTPRP